MRSLQSVAYSAPRKPGWPALSARLDAFLEVLRLPQARLLFELVIGRCLHAICQALAHRGARGDDTERRASCDLARERPGRRAHLLLGHEHVREAHRDGLVALDSPARVEHKRGLRAADQL